MHVESSSRGAGGQGGESKLADNDASERASGKPTSSERTSFRVKHTHHTDPGNIDLTTTTTTTTHRLRLLIHNPSNQHNPAKARARRALFDKMLSRQSRLFLFRRAHTSSSSPSSTSSTTATATAILSTRSKSTKSEANIVNFEAKARVKEHARRIQTSAKVGVEVARSVRRGRGGGDSAGRMRRG